MKKNTVIKNTTEVADMPGAIESSLENLRTGLIGSKGFAIIFVADMDDGNTMLGGSVYGKISSNALSTLCMEAIKTAERVSARGKCTAPSAKAARPLSQTTH